MRKILPFKFDIPIETVNCVAFPLSIIYSNYDYADDWLFFNNLSLKYGTGANDVTLDMPSHLNWACFEKRVLDILCFNIEKIVDEINDNRYVYFAVDEYYIPNRDNYGKNKFVHDILVYGYDMENEVFYTCGFDKNKRYSGQQLGFSIIKNAVSSASEYLQANSEDYEFYGPKNYFSLKLNMNMQQKYDTDRYGLINIFREYLKGRVEYESSSCICYFGELIYNEFSNNVRALDDLRNWCILKEHKQFMMNYIMTHYADLIDNIERAKAVINNANLCLNLAIKWQIDKKEKTLNSLKNTLELVHKGEVEIVTEMLSKLE